MIRNKVLSVLALTGLVVGLTVAQAPQPPASKSDGGGKAPDPRKSDPTADAMRNHPDIRLAEAKLRMAEAELAQAKLIVAQRIAIAEAKVQGYRIQMEHASEIRNRLAPVTGVSRAELIALDRDVASAKTALISAEAELIAARGVPHGAAAPTPEDRAIERGMAFLRLHQDESQNMLAAYLAAMLELSAKLVPTSTATDKLRELLDKRVKVDIKHMPFVNAMSEFVKQAGLDGITIRAPDWANAATLKKPPMIGPLEGEQTVAGWLQLIVDDFNQSLQGVPMDHAGKHDIYVREYGLLMTKTTLAPSGAMTLNEYVRQLRATKEFEKSQKK